MLRGRHRGLPVAIDRAILLPSEFEKTSDEPHVNATHDDRCASARSKSPCPVSKEDGASSSNEGAGCFEGQLEGDEKRSGSYDTVLPGV
jgi:hypothetical protein